jgi:hypothetical protein
MHKFLAYENKMYVSTMGEHGYALKLAKILALIEIYLGHNIISQGVDVFSLSPINHVILVYG